MDELLNHPALQGVDRRIIAAAHATFGRFGTGMVVDAVRFALRVHPFLGAGSEVRNEPRPMDLTVSKCA